MAEETLDVNVNDMVLKESLSFVITSFVYYNSLLRDTLEYVLTKDEYSVEFYNYKKNGLTNEPKINSPLKNFIDSNGEKGAELAKKLEDFADLVYGDDSTILHVNNDKLIVDKNQHVQILEGVIPLHEELNQIIKLHIQFSHDNPANKIDEEPIQNLLFWDEIYYRGVALLNLFQELISQFKEYNKIRSESKGEKTAASNYVERDLSKLVSLTEFVTRSASTNDQKYVDAKDAMNVIIELMTAKRQLPEGKTFEDFFKSTEASIRELIIYGESSWREAYSPCLGSLIKKAELNKQEKESK
ncbi:MAG: hypothetical protein RR578_04625 [Bacilli bacterium]